MHRGKVRTMENLLIKNLLHNDNFVSLGHVPSNNSALFVVLKGDFYVYHRDRIVSLININFAERTWGYSTVESPENFYIIDKRFNELYAEIRVTDDVIEILFNEMSFNGWHTIHGRSSSEDLEKSVKLYLTNLFKILKEEKRSSQFIRNYLVEKISVIYNLIKILDSKLFFIYLIKLFTKNIS